MLHISSLTVACGEKSIINNFNLTINAGSIHALMGPNGSGKSTLANALIGNPQLQITNGTIHFNDQEITSWSPDERARAGIFLSFQHPQTIPGLRIINFLKEVYQALTQQMVEVATFQERVFEAFRLVGLDPHFAYRNVNEGFSGGEKKRFEMVQCYLFNPTLIILDELDSGLDVDALKMVTDLLRLMKERNPNLALLIITHYRRILDYLNPQYIHILGDGSIIESGDARLLNIIENKGYENYKQLS